MLEEARFIVTGDLHFRSENPRNRKDVFEDALLGKLHEVFELAKEHQADAIIIPGDIFDSPNVGIKTIAKLGSCINTWIDEFDTQVLVVSGNHDLPAGNKAALPRTPFGLLSKFGFIRDLEDETFYIPIINNGFDIESSLEVTGCGFDFRTDSKDGDYQFIVGPALACENTVWINVVHTMLLPASPAFNMRHTLIDQVETDADIIISGHYHEGFGVIRRKDGKLFINPGALCRLSASEAEMKRTVQVALLTVKSKTDFDAELIALKSTRPADEVLDREAIIEEKKHDNWLDAFFQSLNQEGEAKFLEVREIVDSIASKEKISPAVKDEALRRIGSAREKLGREAG